MNKKIIIGLIGVCFVGLVLGLLYYIGSSSEKIHPLCADFKLTEDKISCNEAVSLTLGKYPGEVYNVEKAEYEDKPGWKVEIKAEAGEEVFPMMKMDETEPVTYLADEYQFFIVEGKITDKGVNQKEVEQIIRFVFGEELFSEIEINKVEEDVNIFEEEPDIRDVWEVKVLFPEEKEIEFMGETILIQGYEILIDYKTGEFLMYSPTGPGYGKEYQNKNYER